MNVETEKIAIFLDVENLTQWIKEKGPEKLLDEINIFGHPIVRRAYGNWTSSSIANFQSSLNRLGFELVHNFHPVSGKNSSDIQMTVDVIEYAWNLNDISWFVLATGDSDFSPLFRRLREMGKGVIGVGPRSTLSETVKTSCSRYIYTESVIQKGEVAIQSAYEDAVDNVSRVLNSFSDGIHLPTLKSKLLNIDSAFDEKQLGYKSFSSFLESIEDITLNKNKTECCINTRKSSTLPKGKFENNNNLTSQYKTILRSKKWRILPKEFLILIFERMINLPPLTKDRIFNEITNSIGNIITPTDARKAYAIFMKCKLLKLTTSTDDQNEKLWQIKDTSMSHTDMLKSRDIAIIVRIIYACLEENISLKNQDIEPLLYSTNSPEAVNSIIAQANKLVGNSTVQSR